MAARGNAPHLGEYVGRRPARKDWVGEKLGSVICPDDRNQEGGWEGGWVGSHPAKGSPATVNQERARVDATARSMGHETPTVSPRR